MKRQEHPYFREPQVAPSRRDIAREHLINQIMLYETVYAYTYD
jgi:hypothetical protein